MATKKIPVIPVMPESRAPGLTAASGEAWGRGAPFVRDPPVYQAVEPPNYPEGHPERREESYIFKQLRSLASLRMTETTAFSTTGGSARLLLP